MAGRVETALFARLIDHAPLFPPAQLPLPAALEEHRQAREGPHGWIVRRFVVPASVLAHLDGEPLELSVVRDVDFDPSDARVKSLEVPPNGSLWLVGDETYVETDAEVVPVFAEQLARSGCRLKVRCGPKAPSVASLAATIRACKEHSLPFKATAGLHHAVRTKKEHGFVNLLAAAVFGDEEAALAEDDAEAFRIDGDAFRWRDRAGSVEDAHRGRELFVAFGSCSFSEPVDDLIALALLAA
ncbi:MAG TPA: hypothetical protein VKA45_10720 [Gaiellaceae bacterium]|nr:hypothetical protein [Gaiellaceae bacterium]